MKLFKYVQPERIDILRNQYIRFSQPYAMNDPFESQPFYTDHVDINPFLQLAKFSKIVQHYAQTGEKLEAEIAEYENERKKPEKNILSWYINIKLASLSLTTKHDDLLMWAHYASNHSGFVIELESEHPFFTDSSRYLYKVPYNNNRPTITLVECEALVSEMAHCLKNRKIIRPVIAEQLNGIFRKSEHWSYEDEWRLLAVPELAINHKKEDLQYAINACDDSRISESFESNYLAFYNLPSSCIKSIYCGSRMAKGLVRELFFLIKNNDCYSHVNLQLMKLDNECYKLNPREVRESDILSVGELMYVNDVREGKRKPLIPKWYWYSPLNNYEKQRKNAVLKNPLI